MHSGTTLTFLLSLSVILVWNVPYVSCKSTLIVSNCSLCQTIPVPTSNDVTFMLNDIFDTTVYDRRVFPKFVQNETLYVDVNVQLYAITDVDEVAGVMSLMGKLTVIWNDEYLCQKYIPGHHVPYEMDNPQSEVWTPPITVFNSVSKMSPIYDKNYQIKSILAAAKNYWRAGVVTQTGCVVDASYYPFDTQECELIFTIWDYTAEEVMFQPTATELDTEYYAENEEWVLSKSEMLVYNTTNRPYLKYTLTLKRRPVFFMINMICPLVLVGLLNSLVFVLPAEAGERIGFAVNVFLTFAIYLTILAANLPKTSQPLAMLSYYLSTMLGMSSISTLVTIFTLRIHNKDPESNVPRPFALLIATMTMRICQDKYKGQEDNDNITVAPPARTPRMADDPDAKRPISRFTNEPDTKRSVSRFSDNPDGKRPLTSLSAAGGDEKKEALPQVVEDDSDEEEESEAPPEIIYGVNWKTVSKTLDKFFFVLFSIGSLAISGVFLVPLVMRMSE